jgi:hypothetical protein
MFSLFSKLIGGRVRMVMRKKRVRKTIGVRAKQHQASHSESARALATERVLYWNQFYNFTYKRIAIRNQSTRWGSCSSIGNLNFNYKMVFLPPHLVDYIVVHELCHLYHFNHGREFWELVAKTIPEYEQCVAELKQVNLKTLRKDV